VLLAGDIVRLKRTQGRMLESPEEAVILGANNNQLFYKVSEQSER